MYINNGLEYLIIIIKAGFICIITKEACFQGYILAQFRRFIFYLS